MDYGESVKGWLITFWRVLVLPTSNTFAAESKKAKRQFGGSVAWLALFGIFVYAIGSITLKEPLSLSILVVAILLIPITVIFFTTAMHFFYQRVFHKKQYLYDEFIYLCTAILISIQVVYMLLGFILPDDFLIYLNYIVYLYQLYLVVVAYKTLTNLNYWQSIVSVVLSLGVGILVFFCTMPFIASLMGGVSSVF